MTLPEAVKSCYAKYFTLKGRASRSEYWWFYFFRYLGSVLLSIAGIGLFSVSRLESGAAAFFCLLPAMLLIIGSIAPAIAIMVRRLHDSNHSGGWIWLFFLLSLISNWAIGVLNNVYEHSWAYGLDESPTTQFMLLTFCLLALALELPWLIFMCRGSTPGDNRYGARPGDLPNSKATPDSQTEEALRRAAAPEVPPVESR